jgi:monothiol glutaredoxin
MNTVFEQIRGEVEGHDVVLFMKGSPVFPQCGFSAAVVQILSHLGVKFKGIDVLQDPGLRQGMAETGELEQLFTEKGVASQTVA